MSVNCFPAETFEKLASSLWRFKEHPHLFIYRLRDLTKEQLQQHVRNWCESNERTYCKRYPDQEFTNDYLELKLSFNTMPLPVIYCLKLMHGIKYNIRLKDMGNCTTKQEITLTDSYTFLCDLIAELSYEYIRKLPEYEKLPFE